jgi:hypothetical protein
MHEGEGGVYVRAREVYVRKSTSVVQLSGCRGSPRTRVTPGAEERRVEE